MALRKVKFAPGVNKEGTDYTADQGWVDSDKIRFRQGNPEKIGGWQKYLLDSFEGVCRSLHAWSTLSSVRPVSYTHLTLPTNREV